MYYLYLSYFTKKQKRYKHKSKKVGILQMSIHSFNNLITITSLENAYKLYEYLLKVVKIS